MITVALLQIKRIIHSILSVYNYFVQLTCEDGVLLSTILKMLSGCVEPVLSLMSSKFCVFLTLWNGFMSCRLQIWGLQKYYIILVNLACHKWINIPNITGKKKFKTDLCKLHCNYLKNARHWFYKPHHHDSSFSCQSSFLSFPLHMGHIVFAGKHQTSSVSVSSSLEVSNICCYSSWISD